MEQHDIGLFDQLRSAHPSSTEQHIGGERWIGDLIDQQRFQRPIAGELLIEAAIGVPAVDHVARQLPPTRRLVASAELVGEVGAAAQVPAGHHVGEGVVVDDLVVFVRTDHAADVSPPVRLDRHPAGPVAGGVEHEVGTRAAQEPRIAGPRGVLARRPGDVGDDVLLQFAGADLDHVTALADELTRGDIATCRRRLPRKPGTGEPGFLCRLARRRQAADAVLEHRPGGGGVDRRQRRENEHVGVPEHVSAIGRTGQAARPDRHLAVAERGRQQVKHGEARRQLVARTALDVDSGGRPTPRPRRAVLGEEAVEPRRDELAELLGDAVPCGHVALVCCHSRQSFDEAALPDDVVVVVYGDSDSAA